MGLRPMVLTPFLSGGVMNTKLKFKIIESGKPQIAIAKELGVPEPYLSKVVNGWIEPKAEVKEKIARALECSVEEIFASEEG